MACHGKQLLWKLLGVLGPVKPPCRGAHAAEKKMVVQGGIGLTGVRVGDTWILELSKDLNSGTWHEMVSNAHHHLGLEIFRPTYEKTKWFCLEEEDWDMMCLMMFGSWTFKNS